MSVLDNEGATPLLVACERGLGDIAVAMLDLDVMACSIDTRNVRDHTALYWARERKLPDVALRLLRCEGARSSQLVVDN